MNRLRGVVLSLIVTSITIGLSVSAAPAHAQTPGQVPVFTQPGTGACNAAKSNDCVNSVITQDGSGNIGIGTTTPVAALDVATGDLNLAGNLFKGGALFLHDSGTNNTFLGQHAGNLTITGSQNTAGGAGALQNDTSGDSNTASGAFALQLNTTGRLNTAIGSQALLTNATGTGNTASGVLALRSNIDGHDNTAAGLAALELNTSGFGNTASGVNALLFNATGVQNTAAGTNSLGNNTTGSLNTAIGVQALLSNTAGTSNTAMGFNADVSAGDLTNATAIGSGAVVDASNKIRLGNISVTVIEGQVPYTFPSDRNQKERFQPVDGEDVLKKIGGLNVASWNYIGHDPRQFRHYGPVAQEFFAAFGHDAVGTIGTPTTINSGDLEGILLIAVQALQKQNADLKARIDALERHGASSHAHVR